MMTDAINYLRGLLGEPGVDSDDVRERDMKTHTATHTYNAATNAIDIDITVEGDWTDDEIGQLVEAYRADAQRTVDRIREGGRAALLCVDTIDKDTAFARPFGTIRRCRVCGCLVAGGPTACTRCAELGP